MTLSTNMRLIFVVIFGCNLVSITTIHASREQWKEGHYYSAIPSLEDVERAISQTKGSSLPGIDLRPAHQLTHLVTMNKVSEEIVFKKESIMSRSAQYKGRYYVNNNIFNFGDAFTLSYMIRHVLPARIIEIGSGLSSCVMVDTVEELGHPANLTFIEPDPVRLVKNMGGVKIGKNSFQSGSVPFTLYEDQVQNIDLSFFKNLQAGDILFIDSSHTAKAGSDVLHLFFNVIPILPAGIHVHVHDIFWPFEYPSSWFKEGRFWTEAYLLKALLQNNRHLHIDYWQSYIHNIFPEKLGRVSEAYARNCGGHELNPCC